MLSLLILAAVHLSVGQAPAGQATQSPKPAAAETQAQQMPDVAPFDEPTDKDHLADIRHDEEEGKKYAAEVEKEQKLSKNQAYQDRVERIGLQLANIANHNHLIATWGDKRLNPFHYTYKVLQGDDINAFSLPGGHIYVYEGLLKFVTSDDELAGVLAHETSHAAFRHVPTLEHEANKIAWVQIPALIAAILSHSGGGLLVTEAAGLSQQSGWSQKAEKAADFGGFQILMKSQYSPVAMLTFMERLSAQERSQNGLLGNLGILQTHPLTRDRADAMIHDLEEYNVPIQRSKASPAYRVTLKDLTEGAVQVDFGGKPIYTFGGLNARERAELAQTRLTAFYDSVPQLYDVTTYGDEIMWHGKMLLTILPEDAQAAGTTQDKLLMETYKSLQDTLYHLAYLVWDE